METYQTETDILEQCRQQSNRKAWNSFFYKYHKLIVSHALRMGLNRVQAEEVLQETMIILFQKLQAFNTIKTGELPEFHSNRNE